MSAIELLAINRHLRNPPRKNLINVLFSISPRWLTACIQQSHVQVPATLADFGHKTKLLGDRRMADNQLLAALLTVALNSTKPRATFTRMVAEQWGDV